MSDIKEVFCPWKSKECACIYINYNETPCRYIKPDIVKHKHNSKLIVYATRINNADIFCGNLQPHKDNLYLSPSDVVRILLRI